MIAAHPVDPERMSAYLLKAAREAKRETSWLDPDPSYESALDAFCRGMLNDAAFVASVDEFVRGMAPAWHAASLSQLLLKLVCPGVPDIYQGCELWDLSLVDPDNRRPVDYEVRRSLLRSLERLDVAAIMARADHGLPKLHLLHQGLQLRERRPSAFDSGAEYRALDVAGSRAEHVIACGRAVPTASPEVVAIAVRHSLHVAGAWDDTTVDVPGGPWCNVLTGENVAGGHVLLGDLLHRFPVALMERA